MSEKEIKNNVANTKDVKKRGQLMSVFTRDYKYEGIVLLILAVIAVVLGILIVTGTLSIPSDVFLLGDYPLVFAWILVGLGIISFILAVWPFYKPSVDEMKRVSWISRGELLKSSLTVFLFVLIFSLFFTGTDSAFSALIKWLTDIGAR